MIATPARPRALIITGYSGAGTSSCLKFLEDMDYEVFDNFPLTLVAALLADPASSGKPVAIAIDARTRGFTPEALIQTAQDTGATLVFVTADESELLKRFTETRRKHPLAADRPASAGIAREHEIFKPLRDAASFVIDTTGLSLHDLRRAVAGHFEDPRIGHLTITLMSFGFRNGLPRDADMVMDVRFLSNPHWVPELRPLTGMDRAVGDYVSGDPAFADFVAAYKNLVAPLLPRYAAEGKSYLTLAIGCTGGRHRSVYTVETLRPWLESQGYPLHVVHRDVGK